MDNGCNHMEPIIKALEDNTTLHTLNIIFSDRTPFFNKGVQTAFVTMLERKNVTFRCLTLIGVNDETLSLVTVQRMMVYVTH